MFFDVLHLHPTFFFFLLPLVHTKYWRQFDLPCVSGEGTIQLAAIEEMAQKDIFSGQLSLRDEMNLPCENMKPLEPSSAKKGVLLSSSLLLEFLSR